MDIQGTVTDELVHGADVRDLDDVAVGSQTMRGGPTTAGRSRGTYTHVALLM